MTNHAELKSCLSYFREFVTSRQGERELVDFDGPVIGVSCNFVPDELVWAVGGRTVRLCGGDSQWQEEGENLLSRHVCPVATATAGLPQMDPQLWQRLDLLVIPASCDAKKTLAEVFGRDKPVHVMNVPAMKDDGAARAYWLDEVQRLVGRIEQVAGRKITRVELDKAVRLSMERESLFRELLELRYGQNGEGSPMTGGQFQFVAGASFADEPSRYTENLRTLVDVLRKAGAAGCQVAGAGAPRVLLAGAPLIYPNFRLLEIIEKAGATIVSDTSCTATQAFYQHLAPRDWSLREMLKALAEKKLLPCMCPCFGSFQDRMLRMRELVRVSKADGIIFHELRTCTLFAAEGEFLRRELEEGESIPLLIVNTDYASSDKEYLRTRVEAFLEILGH